MTDRPPLTADVVDFCPVCKEPMREQRQFVEERGRFAFRVDTVLVCGCGERPPPCEKPVAPDAPTC